MIASFNYNDGGRSSGGWKGRNASDCTPRSIAIATGKHYRAVRKELDALCDEMTGGIDTTTNNGTPTPVKHRYLTNAGWFITITKGQYLKDLPQIGVYIVCLPRHSVTVIDGVIQDTWDSGTSRRTKCGSPRMLGYYSKP
jgi:hypothetical protein|tara:strand:+ start:253 stop:672 length:420 start_codon:yes stop_codon:yes gene_type:complete